MNPNEPLFWLVIITGIIAVSFLMIAGAMIAMAVFVKRAVKSVNRLEERLEPLMTRATALSEQGTAIADETAEVAHEKVHLVSRAIDTTHERVMDTTEFIQRKVIEPARELAAILAGLRRGLEVLVAPAPSPINRSYGDDEMFIG